MINGPRRRTLITGVAFGISLISLIWATLPVSGDSTQDQLRAAQLTNQKQEELQRKRESFKIGRELLLKRGVPFDPDVLLEGDWQVKLAPAFAAMP